MNETELREAIESTIAKQHTADTAQLALMQAQRDRDTAVNALRVQAELTAGLLKNREVIYGDNLFRIGHNGGNDYGCRQAVLTPLVTIPVVAPTPAPQVAPPVVAKPQNLGYGFSSASTSPHVAPTVVAKPQPAPSLKGGSVPPAIKPK